MQRTAIAVAVVVFGVLSCRIQAKDAVRTVDVHAHRFAFEPSAISVSAGETIVLRLISDDVPHSLLIKQLDIDVTSSKSHPGETTFKAQSPGDYSGRCGHFCGSGHAHMQFTVHVNPN